MTGSGVTAHHSEWGASPLGTEQKCSFPNSLHECRSLFTSEIWPFSSFLRFGIEYTEQARRQKKTVAFSDKSASEKPASLAAPALCGRREVNLWAKRGESSDCDAGDARVVCYLHLLLALATKSGIMAAIMLSGWVSLTKRHLFLPIFAFVLHFTVHVLSFCSKSHSFTVFAGRFGGHLNESGEGWERK